jgi:hypothetical protein
VTAVLAMMQPRHLIDIKNLGDVLSGARKVQYPI